MQLVPLTKRCNACGDEKSASEFSPHNTTADRLATLCKRCNSEYTKARHAQRRAEMGEEAWLAHQREIVRRSRARRDSDSERRRSRIRNRAIARLIKRHQAEFAALVRLAEYEADTPDRAAV